MANQRNEEQGYPSHQEEDSEPQAKPLESARTLPRWLVAWVLASLVFCVPVAALNILFVVSQNAINEAISHDPQYIGVVIAAGVLLNQVLSAIGLVYFVQFSQTRRIAICCLALAVPLVFLAARGVLILSEEYVSIH